MIKLCYEKVFWVSYSVVDCPVYSCIPFSLMSIRTPVFSCYDVIVPRPPVVARSLSVPHGTWARSVFFNNNCCYYPATTTTPKKLGIRFLTTDIHHKKQKHSRKTCSAILSIYFIVSWFFVMNYCCEK